jgi:hypothetical protein
VIACSISEVLWILKFGIRPRSPSTRATASSLDATLFVS